jgi:hypothetical protein
MPLFPGYLLRDPSGEYGHLPPDFLRPQSVVVELQSRNVQPRRPWGDDKVEIDLSRGLVCFSSGDGLQPESGFQGHAPCLGIEEEPVIKEKLHQGEAIHIRELLADSFRMKYRWKNHELHGEAENTFRWVDREFKSVGSNSGSYESAAYQVFSQEYSEGSDLRQMQVIMAVTGVFLKNTSRRISPSQAFFHSSMYIGI